MQSTEIYQHFTITTGQNRLKYGDKNFILMINFINQNIQINANHF